MFIYSVKFSKTPHYIEILKKIKWQSTIVVTIKPQPDRSGCKIPLVFPEGGVVGAVITHVAPAYAAGVNMRPLAF
ncbi:MAG: hypothetical protein GY859_04635, partial [Desulfobacterales bacterium]|nr:hypothetical protein [Desulfobacterales bacterium]